ncbi:hypothetical protein [Tuwongella immobilis]|uniref:Uncharacterized protein n=1 Tax=Tuwongella immobilis TaxID=692036 RepID=A0A6C2YUK0_9BACT|nr:hypothetical protein [Tuwongella immobilis]VIP05114.1 unnamed protein product [Tuwongella immobilis]VTS07584.1 unnamed protein product [Tuwongella immobilis]
MLDTATMETCRRLVGLYRGVTIERFRAHPNGSAHIVMRITEPATVARLAHCAIHANVGMLVWADSRGSTEEEWAFPDRVRYELRAAPGSGDEPQLAVVLLCVGMAEELADLGVVDREEVKSLRAGWGF